MKILRIVLPLVLLLTIFTACGSRTTPTPEPTVTGLQPGWWNDTIFYEIFVRSFKDSDGDGIGDFNGITEMLDYLNDGDPATTTDLGVTGIWLMPITESESYHGYDVVDYRQVASDYGTSEDFLRMVDEAHRRGIKVIIDLVLNHTSTKNEWFLASDAGDALYRPWYVWETTNPGYTGPWGQQVWYRRQSGYYYAVFWSQMPDLNLTNPAVTQEIQNITSYWLTEMDVDGFRLDAIRYYVEQGSAQADTMATHAWLQGYYQFYKSIDPAVFTVGEAWAETPRVVEYVGDEVDIAFEFDLAEAYVRTAGGPIASSASTQLQLVLDSYPAGQYGIFLTNHDQDRVMSVLAGDVQKARLAAVMMLTSPGVPFIYYGEEIGMTGTKPDEDIRRPMQWNGDSRDAGFTTGRAWRLVADDYARTNVASETADPDSLLNLYRQLIHLRNEHAALRTGSTLVLDGGTQRLYAVLRYDENEAFLVLVNPHTRSLTTDLYGITAASWPIPGTWTVDTVMGLEGATAPQLGENGGLDSYQPFVEIPAGSYTILQFTP
jgi:glycosidase